MIDLDVQQLLAGVDGPLGYGLVALLAAIPWVEILAVIPIGIAVGLDPVAVAVLALVGNLLPIYGIILGWKRVARWLGRRRGADDTEASPRRKRAIRVWNQYGLAGLALVSPILTGVHLATAISMGVGSKGSDVALWMTVSVAGWTVVLTGATVAGLSLF